MPRVKETSKTREQLVNKVTSLRQRITALEEGEIKRKRAEEALR